MANQSSIGKRIRRRIGTTLKRSAKSAQKVARRTAQRTVQKTVEIASQAAGQTAKQGLDQVLLGLQHNKLSKIDPQDLIQMVGRKVLERAEVIRSQLADSPLSPAWLKEVKLARANQSSDEASQEMAEAAATAEGMPAVAAGSLTEASISVPAEGMQPESHEEAEKKSKSKSKKQSATRKVATKGARPKADGAASASKVQKKSQTRTKAKSKQTEKTAGK